MNIFLYIIIFLMGTVFGSFFTLAVYRLPNKIDITHTHSFCPNCKHKLGFFELIPVWSYLFLGGKCKECKQKIRPRYFILEICSGIIFVLIAMALKIDVYNLQIKPLVYMAFLVLYLCAIVIIAGIDKEKRQIEKSVIYYAIGISLIYIIYLCIVDNASIYRYIMYLATTLILLIIDTIILRKKAKTNYVLELLILLSIMVIFTGEIVTILSIIMTLLIIAIYVLLDKLKSMKNKVKKENNNIEEYLRIGFYLCTSNIIMLIYTLFIINW